MKLITRDTDYAVRALCYIANEKNRVIAVSELVRELKIPRPFLRKILQSLHNAGVLKSYKGAGGGFILCCHPSKLALGNIIKIFQGALRLNECLFRQRVCPKRSYCSLRSRIVNIEKRVIKELDSITIAGLLRSK